MKRYIIIIIIAICVVLAVVIAAIIIKNIIKNSILDGPGMVNSRGELYKLMDKEVKHGEYLKIKYSSSGDMNGNLDTIELDVKTGVLTTQYAAMHSDPIEVNEYKIKQEDIDRIIAIIEEYNLVAWSELPQDDTMFALDGPTRMIEIDCASLSGSRVPDFYTIYSHTKFPEGGWEIYSDFVKEIADLINRGEKTNSYTKDTRY